jgi:hypothetical protein
LFSGRSISGGFARSPYLLLIITICEASTPLIILKYKNRYLGYVPAPESGDENAIRRLYISHSKPLLLPHRTCKASTPIKKLKYLLSLLEPNW